MCPDDPQPGLALGTHGGLAMLAATAVASAIVRFLVNRRLPPAQERGAIQYWLLHGLFDSRAR